MTKKPKTGGEYDVGFGKPPKHSQFKKGQSGNPNRKSKSPKSPNQLFKDEGEKTIKIIENGKEQILSKYEVIVKSIFAKACKGDLAAIKFILSLLGSWEPKTLTPGFSWSEEYEELMVELEKRLKGDDGSGD